MSNLTTIKIKTISIKCTSVQGKISSLSIAYLYVKRDTIAFHDDYSWSIMITFADTTYTEATLSTIDAYRLRLTLIKKSPYRSCTYLLSARFWHSYHAWTISVKFFALQNLYSNQYSYILLDFVMMQTSDIIMSTCYWIPSWDCLTALSLVDPWWFCKKKLIFKYIGKTCQYWHRSSKITLPYFS